MAYRTRVVTNGQNLFRIALEELGDALQWNRLAALNKTVLGNTYDPEIRIGAGNTVTINVPARSSAFTGGVIGPA